MIEILLDAALDILKTLPVLALVYALLFYLENRVRTTPALLEKTMKFGPFCGSLAGSVPQCGFSAAASALYLDGYLAPATLVAVFLATSDEALPVLLAAGDTKAAVSLLLVKIVIATLGGYLLRFTLLRRVPHFDEPIEVEMESCGCGDSLLGTVVWRTGKTALLLFVILLVFNTGVHLIGEENLASLMLSGSLLQPILCACIGLIPSCAISVLLAELFASGAIGFGSLVAGLSTGAGFGYIILFSDPEKRKQAISIVAVTWVLAAAAGTLLQIFVG